MNGDRLAGGLPVAPDGRDYDARFSAARDEATVEELWHAWRDFIGTYERPGWGLQVDPATGKQRDASLALFLGGDGEVWRSRVRALRLIYRPVERKPAVPFPEPEPEEPLETCALCQRTGSGFALYGSGETVLLCWDSGCSSRVKSRLGSEIPDETHIAAWVREHCLEPAQAEAR